MKFLDKVVIITGGSSGIGLELAKQFLHEGAIVVITGRDESKLKMAKQSFSIFGSRFLTIQADVCLAADCKRVVEKTNYQYRQIDVLINNAGISAQCEIDDTQAHVIDAVIDSNLKGAIYMTNYCMPYLIRSKGSVLFISSVASFFGLPEYSLYCASKKALTAIAQSISIEARRKQVFVGIAYLTFTENEPTKMAIDAQGRKRKIPKRNSWLLFTREQTAKLIIRQLRWKNRTKTHGIIGKFLRVLGHFPILTRIGNRFKSA